MSDDDPGLVLVTYLAPRPAEWNRDQLRIEANAIGALDVNAVDPDQLAAYFPADTTTTQEQWATLVAAHVPAPVDAPPDLLAIYQAARGGTMTGTNIDKGVKAILAALADALNA